MTRGTGTERAGHERVREHPPEWPRRAEEPEDQPSRQRWRREPEPFEEGGLVEQFGGAAVLEDSSHGAENLRILVRFCVARLLGLAMSGRLGAAELRVERRVAADHLHLLPRHDWERRLLEQLAAQCRERLPEGILGQVLVVAEASAKRGHTFGAFTFYRAGYELSCARQWWEDAERCALGIERLAELEEARRSAILWRRRALVMRRRAEAATARAAECATESNKDSAVPSATIKPDRSLPQHSREDER